MVSKEEAIQKVKDIFPERRIGLTIQYQDLYIVQAFGMEPGEEDMDPFFSVDKDGNVVDFSIMTDGDIGDISKLFLEAQKGSG